MTLPHEGAIVVKHRYEPVLAPLAAFHWSAAESTHDVLVTLRIVRLKQATFRCRNFGLSFGF
jgi:hypothetical protein